ncbi:hypothetical protein NW765_016813 [Fusarium oxysporum]|nr:hypothetical protein NW765_016813 [Fusarium oxysporum]KAJ4247409.1 hypothetical protein NW764_016532 [Fusarium oxysporum]
MPPAHYNCILPAETYDGFVGSIRVRWSNSAIQRLHSEAGEAGIPVTTMKALCEHLAYISAERLQNDQALIRAPPHNFSVDSGTNTVHSDANHISTELSGGTGGRSWTHIYLGGVSGGPSGYDNVYAVGESISKKVKGHKVIDENLSYGSYPRGGAGSAGTQNSSMTATTSSATAHAGSSSSSQGVAYSSWEAGNQTAGDSGQAPSSGEWQWIAQYQRWYNTRTQKYEGEE